MFWAGKGVTYLRIARNDKNSACNSCIMGFMLFCDRGAQGEVPELMRNAQI